MDPDDIKAWALGQESWTFHRWFYQVVGRPAELGEYSHLKRQLGRRPKVVVAGVYRDGTPIIVLGTQGREPALGDATQAM